VTGVRQLALQPPGMSQSGQIGGLIGIDGSGMAAPVFACRRERDRSLSHRRPGHSRKPVMPLLWAQSLGIATPLITDPCCNYRWKSNRPA
jgi:hypothetical protein